MKRLTWRDKAIYSIANALLEYEAQCLLVGKAIEGKAAKKWVSRERYPFGFRKYTPYKTWLQEVAKIPHLINTGWPAETYPGWRNGLSKPNRRCKALSTSVGQLSLFDVQAFLNG
jgi:hypothetical protein